MPPNAPTEIEPLLTAEEVSKAINIPTTTLSNWRRANRGHGLPFVRMGGSTIRYRTSDVQRFIESNLQQAVPQS